MSSLVPSSQAEGRLRVALLLTGVVLVVEVAGGVISHSLALLSDAGHVVTDLVVLGLSAFALRQAGRPVSSRRTYGYHRVGILIALLNAVLLAVIVVGIVFEAVRRLRQPASIDSGLMAVAAVVALVASLFIARSLQSLHGDLTVRSALVHVWGDTGATAAAIVAALVIAFTGWRTVDPLLSLVIAGLIAWSAWRVLWAAVEILLESTPAGLEPSSLVDALMSLPGVREVHDLHVWSLNAQVRAMSAHVLVDDQRVTQAQDILDEVRELVAHRFNIEHTTIQFESAVCRPGEIFCVQPEGHPHLDEAHERLERRQASG